MRLRPILFALALLLPSISLLSAPALAVVLRPSDILVLGTSDAGSGVILVDPVTGAQTLVSAGGVATWRDRWSPSNINDFTVDKKRRLFAIVGDTVVQIDPATGAQSIVIPMGSLIRPVAIAVGNDGDLFVVDQTALGGIGAIFRFDAVTQARSTVSAGGVLSSAFDMEIAAGGDPVVVHNCNNCFSDVTYGNPPVRVESSTGEQAPIPGGVYFLLTGLGLGVDASGGEIVSNGAYNATFIYRINVETGEVVTVGGTAAVDPDDPGLGYRELLNTDAAIDQSGRLLVTGYAFPYVGPSPHAGVFDATIYTALSVGVFVELQVVPGIPGTVGFDLTGETGSFATDFTFLSEPLIALATGTKNGVPALVQQNRKGLGVTQNGTSGPFLQEGEALSLDFGNDLVEPLRFVLWFQNGGFADPFTLTLDVDGVPVAYEVVDGAGQEFQTFEVEGGHAGSVMRFTGGLYSAFRVTEVTVKEPEALGGHACGLGFELVLLLQPLMWLRIRRRREQGPCAGR